MIVNCVDKKCQMRLYIGLRLLILWISFDLTVDKVKAKKIF